MLTRRGWFGWAWGLVLVCCQRLFGLTWPDKPDLSIEYLSPAMMGIMLVTRAYRNPQAVGWDLWHCNAQGKCIAFTSTQRREVMDVENPDTFHHYNDRQAAELGWLGHWSAEGNPSTALLDLDGIIVPTTGLGKIRKYRRLESVRY